MNANIHPYKGYLNTKFHIIVREVESVAFKIVPIETPDGDPILEGVVEANSPYSIVIPKPGEYKVLFSDGSSSTIIVEDGYKFGGSNFKKAFIFDETPWCFIIMNDRTYFYNRSINSGYVETISPSHIKVVSENYVLLSNDNQAENTLYDLEEQKPELCIENIKFFNREILIWAEGNTLNFYSLIDKKILLRTKLNKYFIDEKNNALYFEESNQIIKYKLTQEFVRETILVGKGSFVTLIDYSIAVFIIKNRYKNSLLLYNVSNPESFEELEVENYIASINGESLIDLKERRGALARVDMNEFAVPEADITFAYSEFIFFPCDWAIFYLQMDMTLLKNRNRFNSEEKILLKRVGSKLLNEEFSVFNNNSVFKDESRFLIFNDYESYVEGRNYSGSGLEKDTKILVHDTYAIAIKEGFYYTLSRNGYWDNKIENHFDFSRYEEYGIVKNNDNGKYRSLLYCNVKGDDLVTHNNPTEYIELGHSAIFPGGKVVYDNSTIKKFSKLPKTASPSLKYGLLMENNCPWIIWFENGEEKKQRILTELFDVTTFKNVLLSEDGSKILYRDNKGTEVKDIITGEVSPFDNLSYVQQVNGIRPYFEKVGSLQPTIINPATGQVVDVDLLSEYSFISPNGLFYADTRLDEYVEYYYRDSLLIISKSEYLQLTKELKYPSSEPLDSPRRLDIKNKRIAFINDHLDFLKKEYVDNATLRVSQDKWLESLIDERNIYGVEHFLNHVIGCRGIAKIRRISDGSEVAKINLGQPLRFLNYVSFSYDSKYVAIAGYKDFSHGLFLIYDIYAGKTIGRFETGRAVWNTAFSSKEAVVAYTSDPAFIFFHNPLDSGKVERLADNCIEDRCFLTFSPDGIFVALSNRGYVSKYDFRGEERISWGHQSTTMVELRKMADIEHPIVSFNDLSDAGIAGSSTAKSVASVSFSNDNKRLMMVGRDGVVIIRNLHI